MGRGVNLREGNLSRIESGASVKHIIILRVVNVRGIRLSTIGSDIATVQTECVVLSQTQKTKINHQKAQRRYVAEIIR